MNVMIDDNLPMKLTGEDGYLLAIADQPNFPMSWDTVQKFCNHYIFLNSNYLVLPLCYATKSS